MKRNELEICVRYRGYLRRSDATGLFLSWCPLLDIKSQGTTEAQAKAALDDSVRLFVAHCAKRGILDDVLKSLGLEPSPIGDEDEDEEVGESVSVRPVTSGEAWKPWTGMVPVHLVAAAQMGMLGGASAWPR